MKYGKQNWNRVASLLNRKSGKQCKARWFEWLDPSVKKVEWSRAEEEKLLHLAKLMPAQWRTIAPIVGRTAAQCQEKYELLLDAAAQADGGEGKGDGEGGIDKQNRALRVGEIDTQPETKPARPDPIDMDEDEIEMLQEARARLANTQGKKAKRKGREKMLAEAKRLADLQKRRELKAAGIISTKARTSVSRKRRKEIDYGVEIPFHKHAPAGFHDVESERTKTAEIQEKRMKDIDFGRVNEQNMRSRDKEREAQQKKDKERMKALQKANMQLVVQQTAKANDPLSYRARGTLSMPAPAVSDSELESVAKMSSSMMMPPPSRAGGNSATNALLNDYTERPLPTPMRTPSTGGNKSDTILAEAVNQRRSNMTSGVLHGEENPELSTGTGFEGANPAGSAEVVNETPGGFSVASSVNESVGSAWTNATPTRRDQFGLNSVGGGGMESSDDFSDTASYSSFASSIRSSARDERRAAKKAKLDLINALNSLPAPQFEYELAAPEEPQEAESAAMEIEEDAEEVAKRNAEIKRLEKEVEFAKRTSVAKRLNELPRVGMEFDPKAIVVGKDEVQSMIEEEMVLLLGYDGAKHPLENQKKRKQPPSVEDIPLDELEKAKALLAKEGDARIQSDANRLNVTVEEMANIVAKESMEGAESMVYTPTGWVENPSVQDLTAAYRLEYECLSGTVEIVEKKIQKLQKKLKVKFGGYQKKAESKRAEIVRLVKEGQQVEIDASVFSRLKQMEDSVIGGRIAGLETEVTNLENRQVELQSEYESLV